MSTTVSCPNCGAAAGGQFCANCGVSLASGTCTACGRAVSASARFCEHCGTGLSTVSRSPAVTETTATIASERTRSPVGGAPPAPARSLAWLVPGIALVSLVAFLIGQRAGGGVTGGSGTDVSNVATSGAGESGPGRAPDISRMTPDERATRLFDRVMRYGEQGKQDSARIFAPMAIQAYEMLGPPDAHSRYDIGIISAVSGDATTAAAQADTILRTQPDHLLGLLLAMKAAGLRNDVAARAAFEKRFLAASSREKKKNLKEYADHAPDIDAAFKRSPGAKR